MSDFLETSDVALNVHGVVSIADEKRNWSNDSTFIHLPSHITDALFITLLHEDSRALRDRVVRRERHLGRVGSFHRL